MGKKKGKGTGRRGKKIVDGISTAEMSREQLMGHIKRLQNEIDREREERNFFMLEREKLFSLWSLAVEKITAEKDKARLAEVQRDDARESKEEEIKEQKQKTRFLMSEHLKKLGEARLDYLQRMKLLQDEFRKAESILKETNQEGMKKLGDAKLCLFETIRNLRQDHCEKISELRSQYSREVRRIEVQADILVAKHQDVVDLQSQQDLIQMQTLKDEHINQLIRIHGEQLEVLKEYYTELTVNNLAVIGTLQDELMERKSAEEQLVGELEQSKVKCQQFSQRVQELEGMMVDWTIEERQIASRIKQVQRTDANVRKFQNISVARNRKRLEWMEIVNEALVQKNLEATQEVDFLKQCLGKTIMEMQMKTTMNRILVFHQVQKEKQNYPTNST